MTKSIWEGERERRGREEGRKRESGGGMVKVNFRRRRRRRGEMERVGVGERKGRLWLLIKRVQWRVRSLPLPLLHEYHLLVERGREKERGERGRERGVWCVSWAVHH